MYITGMINVRLFTYPLVSGSIPGPSTILLKYPFVVLNIGPN